MTRRAVSWCLARPNRWFVLAVVVGFALRLAWVLWVTVEPSGPYSDTGQALSMARQFASFQTYRLHGHVSAFFPVGYPLLLSPFAWLSAHTGWFSLPLAASLVNVAAGTTTIVVGAVLAGRWFGPSERTVAAWVLALAAGPIYLTSAALSETVFAALMLLGLLAVTAIVQGGRSPSRGRLLGLGALLGYLGLVRSPGLFLLLLSLVALRVVAGSWRAVLRPALWLVLGTALFLVPAAVRNGIQVGVWTPTSTNNAAFLCQGHKDDAIADASRLTDEDFRPCFIGTPYAPDPDEAAWYGRTIREAIGWALTHPAEEVRLTWEKTLLVLSDDKQALADGQDFGHHLVASPTWEHRLFYLGDTWHNLVLILGTAGFLVLRRGRAAWPLWAPAVGFIVAAWGGVALDRFHHPTMAILAVPASAMMVAMGRWAAQGVTTASDKASELLETEPPPPPAEGLASASRPRSRWAGPHGHPFHPLVAAVAIGAWVLALPFDLISFVADTAWVYVRGSWLLTGMGVGAALVAALLGLVDLLGIPRGTVAWRAGIRHLLWTDAALVLFAASFVLRNESDFPFHDAVDVAPFVLSLLGLGAVAVGAWLGQRMTYQLGVRVADLDDRLAGFEPDED